MLKNLFSRLKGNKNIVYYVIIAVLIYLIYTEWSQKEGFLAPVPGPKVSPRITSKPMTTRVPTTRVPTTSVPIASNVCIEREWGTRGRCSDEIKSPNGKYKLVMKKDGNLVLNKEEQIWDSKTMGKGKAPYRHVMQKDGNYVVYDAENKSTWASGTDGKGTAPYKLIVQDDGNLVVYGADDKSTWASGTDEKVSLPPMQPILPIPPYPSMQPILPNQ